MASQAQEACSDDSYKRAKRVQRAQWLRAAILGANDGLLSTTSLMLGVGAVKEDRWSMVLSGLAGALAGACSMAVGEFVSVSTQRDIEKSIGSQSSSKALDLEGAHEIKNLDSVYVHASPLSSIRSPVMKVMTEEAKTLDSPEVLGSSLRTGNKKEEAKEKNMHQGKWVKALDPLEESSLSLRAGTLLSDKKEEAKWVMALDPPEVSGSSLRDGTLSDKKEEAKERNTHQGKWVKALDPLEVSGSSLRAGTLLSDKKEEAKWVKALDPPEVSSSSLRAGNKKEEAKERNTHQGKWVKTLDPHEVSGSSLLVGTLSSKKEEAKERNTHQGKWVKTLDPPEVSGSSLRASTLSDEKEEGKEENEDEALPSPYKAAAASAFAFLCGSLVPLVVAVLVAENMLRVVLIVVVASVALVLSGAIGAHLGGSSVKVSAARVLVGGWMAMGVTYGLLKPLDRDDNNKGGDKD